MLPAAALRHTYISNTRKRAKSQLLINSCRKPPATPPNCDAGHFLFATGFGLESAWTCLGKPVLSCRQIQGISRGGCCQGLLGSLHLCSSSWQRVVVIHTATTGVCLQSETLVYAVKTMFSVSYRKHDVMHERYMLRNLPKSTALLWVVGNELAGGNQVQLCCNGHGRAHLSHAYIPSKESGSSIGLKASLCSPTFKFCLIVADP